MSRVVFPGLINQAAAARWVVPGFNEGSARGVSLVIAPGSLASLSPVIKAGNSASISQYNGHVQWGRERSVLGLLGMGIGLDTELCPLPKLLKSWFISSNRVKRENRPPPRPSITRGTGE